MDLGKYNNHHDYRMLYRDLYEEAKNEIELLKKSNDVLQNRLQEAKKQIVELNQRVKTQEDIIKELEEKL